MTGGAHLCGHRGRDESIMTDSGTHDDEHAGDESCSLPGILGRTAKAKSKEVMGELTNNRPLRQQARGEYDESIDELQSYEEEHGAPNGKLCGLASTTSRRHAPRPNKASKRKMPRPGVLGLQRVPALTNTDAQYCAASDARPASVSKRSAPSTASRAGLCR
jgi:hypothetical protein